MSSPNKKSCPKCNGELKDNGGAGHHLGHQAAHFGAHGLRHGSPIMLALAAAGAACRLLNPRKYVCQSCGHTVHD